MNSGGGGSSSLNASKMLIECYVYDEFNKDSSGPSTKPKAKTPAKGASARIRRRSNDCSGNELETSTEQFQNTHIKIT